MNKASPGARRARHHGRLDVDGHKLASVGPQRNVVADWRRSDHFRRSSRRTLGSHLRCTSKARVARYYDPATAQFLTRDPAEQVTREAYSYASGDPLDRSDPSGLDDGYSVDPNVRSLFETDLGWYHHGLGPISWFENGGLKPSASQVAATTVAVVQTIWLDTYRPQYGLCLNDSIDDIEGGLNASFEWYRQQLVGVIDPDILDAYIKDTVVMTPMSGPSAALQILKAFIGLEQT